MTTPPTPPTDNLAAEGGPRSEMSEQVAAVLNDHRMTHHGTTIAGFSPCRCSCGLDFACPVFQSWEFCDHYHRAHIADALADILAARDRRVRGEALRERMEALADEFDAKGRRGSAHFGADIGDTIRLWIDRDPRDRADRIEAP